MDTTSDSTAVADTPLVALLERIERLRRRVGWIVGAFALGTVASWGASEHLYRLLALPLTDALIERGDDARLAFTHLTDPFVLYFTVAILGGVVIAMPVVLTQVFIAFSGGRGRRTALALLAFVIMGTLLFAAGLYFCHRILLPFAVDYLLDVGGDFEQAITIREYLKFALRLLLALGLAAELPLVSLYASRLGIVTARDLVRWLPHTVLAIFVLSAFITPPDGASQVLVAVPLIALYVVGIGVAAVAGRGRGRD
jgi:sec-independent protein translocase protein TatC